MNNHRVIRKHKSDTTESIIFEGSKSACLKEIARLKKEAKQYFEVWKWTNSGFCVPKMYFVELE